jgi:hypothetical protein
MPRRILKNNLELLYASITLVVKCLKVFITSLAIFKKKIIINN